MRIEAAVYWIVRVVPWALVLWLGSATIAAIGSLFMPVQQAAAFGLLFAIGWTVYGVRWLRRTTRTVR